MERTTLADIAPGSCRFFSAGSNSSSACDAHNLAVELVPAYQGSTILTSALGQPELMARQARLQDDRRARNVNGWLLKTPGEKGLPNCD